VAAIVVVVVMCVLLLLLFFVLIGVTSGSDGDTVTGLSLQQQLADLPERSREIASPSVVSSAVVKPATDTTPSGSKVEQGTEDRVEHVALVSSKEAEEEHASRLLQNEQRRQQVASASLQADRNAREKVATLLPTITALLQDRFGPLPERPPHSEAQPQDNTGNSTWEPYWARPVQSSLLQMPYFDPRLVPIVYTWVNGSDPAYREVRMKYCPHKPATRCVGGNRDRTMDEIRFSLRSLSMYMPWWQGDLYFVTPGHYPEWLNTSNPRVHLVNQDSLFPPEFKKNLPTFSSTPIEQFLFRCIPKPHKIFLYMNDDYFFSNLVRPEDLFTDNLQGQSIFFERGQVHGREDKAMAYKKSRKKIWLASVYNSVGAFERVMKEELAAGLIQNPVPNSMKRFMKHQPFVWNVDVMREMHHLWRKEIEISNAHPHRTHDDILVPFVHALYLMARYPPASWKVIPDPEATDEFKFVVLNEQASKEIETKLTDIAIKRPRFFTLNDGGNHGSVKKMATLLLSRLFPDPSPYERRV